MHDRPPHITYFDRHRQPSDMADPTAHSDSRVDESAIMHPIVATPSDINPPDVTVVSEQTAFVTTQGSALVDESTTTAEETHIAATDADDGLQVRFFFKNRLLFNRQLLIPNSGCPEFGRR